MLSQLQDIITADELAHLRVAIDFIRKEKGEEAASALEKIYLKIEILNTLNKKPSLNPKNVRHG